MPETRAKYLIWTADDFVVDAYWNGTLIADARRKLLAEVHGATVERVELEVRAGDWLVFNVVNNRMRWDGVSYFGLAGCLEENRFGFVSNASDNRWFACDRPLNAEYFIRGRTMLCVQPVIVPDPAWDQGQSRMQQNAGNDWNGTPVWGKARNTWLKVLVD